MPDTTPDTFNLQIRLGNDGMLTPDDVAAALREVADSLINAGTWREADYGLASRRIVDANGNRVGSWSTD